MNGNTKLLKTFAAILLAAAMLLSLAGCGKSSYSASASQSETIAESTDTAAAEPSTAESTPEPEEQKASASDNIALIVDGESYSYEYMQIVYANQFYNFINSYEDYVSYFGLDISQGLTGLDSQNCMLSDVGTWKDYFLEAAKNSIIGNTACIHWAEKNGISFTADEKKALEDDIVELKKAVSDSGSFDSFEEYLIYLYGVNISEETVYQYQKDAYYALKAYNFYSSSLSFTDEEITAYYETMNKDESTDYDYNMTAMRHILIKAEEDENGICSVEAITAARARAEEIYEEWKTGEATEESFAELANQYSDDSGSNTVGGLYEDIYKDQMVSGINSFLFEEGRKAGDTTIVDNCSSYTGTHIVYFVGYGENYGLYTAENQLKSEAVNTWYYDLVDQSESETGPAWEKIG